jgi:starch phosphorylase
MVQKKKNESIFFTDETHYCPEPLEEAFAEHLEYSLVKSRLTVKERDSYQALALAIRDRLIRRWLRTQHEYEEQDVKRVYYLSMEYLMGRLLGSILINLGEYESCYKILKKIGYSLEEIRQIEPDMGLGNGGLGRLAACFLDSMATLQLPAYGYGIRYEYGIFQQEIMNGYQLEKPDNWLRFGNPWEIVRPEHTYRVRFKGRVVMNRMGDGRLIFDWIDTEDVLAVAYDIPIPGYQNGTVNNLRLWQAKGTNEFDFQYFNSGDYLAAVESKNLSENITKALYPNDSVSLGKTLRLKQEYFFVSASLQNIIGYFQEKHKSFDEFPDKIAIQLNDTHPAIAIPELMRILMDEKGLGWDEAWEITCKTFGYTNHTILPEALESWPLKLIEELLPRHLQIINEINRRYLELARSRGFFDEGAIGRMSIVDESGDPRIRMANLAIIGSHSVNGVSKLHTNILTNQIFPDFYKMSPQIFNNKTNGVTPRRWLKKANPLLSGIITDRIGEKWVKDLEYLRELEPLANDPEFRESWRNTQWMTKKQLTQYIKGKYLLPLNNSALFDVQVKRIHEYKRQLLNLLHVVTLYNRMRDKRYDQVPRVVLFAGKASPAYFSAKLIIKLICSVADVINRDPVTKDLLKVLFLENYGVSLAEKIIPAADLSEQISTAGYEASGTGNMKFGLNGALTIGTHDGANLEIAEEVGMENIFLFGLKADEIVTLRNEGYQPQSYYQKDDELRQVLDMIRGDYFNPLEPGIFHPLIDGLIYGGDPFFVLADYRDYVETQEAVSKLYSDSELWTRKSILNVARMGKFSSDRTITEYAREIWNLKPVPIPEESFPTIL